MKKLISIVLIPAILIVSTGCSSLESFREDSSKLPLMDEYHSIELMNGKKIEFANENGRILPELIAGDLEALSLSDTLGIIRLLDNWRYYSKYDPYFSSLITYKKEQTKNNSVNADIYSFELDNGNSDSYISRNPEYKADYSKEELFIAGINQDNKLEIHKLSDINILNLFMHDSTKTWLLIGSITLVMVVPIIIFAATFKSPSISFGSGGFR